MSSELKAVDKSDTNYLIMEILSLASSSQHRLQRFDLMLSTRYRFYKLNKIVAGTLWTLIPIYMHNTKDALT